MTKVLTSLAALAALAFSVACNNNSDGNNPYKSIELGSKATEFVQKGNSFAFEFIDRISTSTDKDYIISPLSMQFLLGMILDGAQGATADEICSVLGYGKGEVEAVNEFCLSMLGQLPSLDKKTTLNIANAIFVDDGWPLLESYKSTVGKYYKAEVSNLDFSNGQASLSAINGWCSKHTNGLIPKILDNVSPDMLAYLLNAIYFKSQWQEKFKTSSTSQETFTDESGVESKVMMMKQHKSYGYTENDIYKAVRMPYGNGAFCMFAFLPMEGHKVEDVVAALKESDWQSYGMFSCSVDLWLPKFETTFHIKLNDILSEMGMPLSFDSEKADFGAMSRFALCLSFVQQDAIIKVDEEGSEAAVVSSAGMEKNSAPLPGDNVVFHADHPFLYLITESSTGAILFAGRYGGK